MSDKVPNLFTHTFKLFLCGAAFIIFISAISGLFGDSKSDATRETRHSERRDFTQMELMDQVHRKQLRKIQGWFIETGFGEFYKTRDMTLVKKYVENRGYHFRVRPSIDKFHNHEGKRYHTLARIVIQAKNIYNQLWCLAQIEHNGNIYEYWVIQEAARAKSNYRNCEFMVSETESKDGRRKIIHSSSQFFSEHIVSEGFTFSFPKEKVRKLRVYNFPECYQETEMEEVKKITDGL